MFSVQYLNSLYCCFGFDSEDTCILSEGLLRCCELQLSDDIADIGAAVGDAVSVEKVDLLRVGVTKQLSMNRIADFFRKTHQP
jgi:hypothetical protein